VSIRAASPRGMYIGPEEVLLTLDVELEPQSTATDMPRAIADIERDIRVRYPRAKRIYIEAASIASPPG
jgi:hypothetical protein